MYYAYITNALIHPQLEDILRQTILPELEKGRKDFDRPHTEAVVYWIKDLLTQLHSPTLDSEVLITAAYAHDWGYIGLFDGVDSSDPDEIKKRKPLHMERGAGLISALMKKQASQFLNNEQQTAVSHLVLVHDRVEDLQTESEKLIMEADTLGMLDASRVKPTFSKADNEVFIEKEIYGRRLPAFLHEYAKEQAKQVLLSRINFYK